ncbi:MAG: response regulator transcription factor [Bacteroidia bacterium]|nr:response regulator transcription factor [Bacteroidia bacterium]
MIKYLIIEDEPKARQTLRLMMENAFPDFQLLAEFDKVSLAAPFIKEHKPEFVFLDVQLNGEIGLDLVNYFDKGELDFEIIFTTAYSGYALEAFTLSAIDYILKPINIDRFTEAVNRVIKRKNINIEQLMILQQVSTTDVIDRIVIKNLDGHHIVFTNDIVYLKADNVYTEFYLTQGKKLVASKPIKEYDILCTQPQFFRTHRSFIVNINEVQTYHKGQGIITMSNSQHISLARDKKKDFEELLNQ